MAIQIVAGLSIKNLAPHVWVPATPGHLPALGAVMVSYAEFHQMPARRRKAMDEGLRDYLHVPPSVTVYLDNGAFYFLGKGKDGAYLNEYEEFVREARPDWYPIPQDYIPTPGMTDSEQMDCLRRTMAMNRAYRHDGYVPIIHVSRQMDEYLRELEADELLRKKPVVGLGGAVPNLLRAPKALPYGEVIEQFRRTRAALSKAVLHVFGVGGTATLHLARLLGVDSIDSSGWRNRAARGIVQLPGSGDRGVANLGSWRVREPSADEWRALASCQCPACRHEGLEGLQADKMRGFSNRAVHNLWVLLNEADEIERHLADGSYGGWYENHLDNSIYLPLIRQAYADHARPDPATPNTPPNLLV